jgi:uncharacterized protein DUF4314
MDTQGARMLAARIRAGVRVGTQIEFRRSEQSNDQLRPGDRGIVSDIADTGDIVVNWDRGFASEIDPDTTEFDTIAA